jgi:hypothetical protein
LEKGYSCPTYSIACFDIPQKIPARFAGFGDGRFSLGWIVFITLKLAKSE